MVARHREGGFLISLVSDTLIVTGRPSASPDWYEFEVTSSGKPIGSIGGKKKNEFIEDMLSTLNQKHGKPVRDIPNAAYTDIVGSDVEYIGNVAFSEYDTFYFFRQENRCVQAVLANRDGVVISHSRISAESVKNWSDQLLRIRECIQEDDIVIRFFPFEVSRFPYWAAVDGYSLKVGDERTIGLKGIDWCSLPDILLEKDTRKIVGLSFSIAVRYDKDVQAFVNTVGDDKCRHVVIDKLHQDSHYQGFGKMNRLELYWEELSDEVICEAASLDNGAWLFLSRDIDRGNVSIPFGYWLAMVGETKEDHQLR